MILAEKIEQTFYINQEDFVSHIQPPVALTSFVFSSWISKWKLHIYILLLYFSRYKPTWYTIRNALPQPSTWDVLSSQPVRNLLLSQPTWNAFSCSNSLQLSRISATAGTTTIHNYITLLCKLQGDCIAGMSLGMCC